MKVRTVISLLFLAPLCLALAFGGCSTAPRPAAQSAALPFKVGMAEIDITPPLGHRMAGYYDERFATGVHDPLMAKAIILQQGDKKVALVFCDLVGLSLNVSTNARARASRE